MERHVRILGVAALFSFPLFGSSVRAEVYLNRIMINRDTKEYVIQDLNLVGTGLAINRQYQNDYGQEMDLPPGPPFIIEKSIHILNTENAGAMFTVDASGMGAPFGDPFELRFQTVVPNVITIEVGGSVIFHGSMLDPVVLKGSYAFIKWGPFSGYYSDSTDVCEFTQCIFEQSNSSEPLRFEYGQVLFDQCTFRDYNRHMGISCRDVTTQGLVTPTSFRMTSCYVNNSVFASRVVSLQKVRVTLENNRFEGNTVTSIAPDVPNLVRMEQVVIERIADNVSVGNNTNTFYATFTGGWVVGKSYIQVSEGLPLVASELYVEPSGDLEVAPGSVIKLEGGFRIKGRVSIKGSVLTSWQDDEHGGDSDFRTQPATPARWDSISVWRGGNLTMAGCQVLYSQYGVCASGGLELDSCALRSGGGAAVSLLALEDQVYRISKCRMSGNTAGVRIHPASGHVCEVWLDGDSVIQNISHGVTVDIPPTGETRLIVLRSRIAGNRGDGINITGSAFLKSIQVKYCRLEANGGDGLMINNSTVFPDVTIASSVFSGNGYLSGAKSGVNITRGKFSCSGNTFAHNAIAGLRVSGVLSESCHVDNNLFHHNGYYGYWGSLPRSLAFNHFFGNTQKEMNVSYPSGSIQTVEALCALGGDYATNQGGEPMLETPLQGIIQMASYNSRLDQSTIVATAAIFDDPAKKGVIIRPELSQSKWYASVLGHADTLMVAGNIGATVLPGDTLEIFDYRPAGRSPLIDHGGNDRVVSLSDVDGNPRISDGDGDNDKTVDIGAFEFGAGGVPPNPLAINTPLGGTFWLAGEPHEITWSASSIPNVNLYYHLDYASSNRSSWRPIATGVPSSPGTYSWRPSDTVISAKCKVMVADASDTTVNVKSDLFRIKPYVLTRLVVDGSYERYHPAVDGWSFENSEENMWPQIWWSQFDYVKGIDPYTGLVYPPYFSATHGPGALSALPENFPDWPLFVSVFGKPACYFTIQSASIYRPSALLKWGAVKDRTWEGSCAGFAISSYLAFDHKLSFLQIYPDVGQFDRLYSRSFTPWIRKVINSLWIHQFGRDQEVHDDTAAARTPLQTLSDLRTMLLREPGDNAYLSIVDPDSGGHALNPYRLRQDPQFPDLYRISVYDSNYPADSTLEVVIDTAANTWVYAHAVGWNAGSGCYLDLPSSMYLAPPAPLFSIHAPGPILAKESDDSSRVTYLIGRSASVAISNSLGQSIGYPRQAVPSTIPGARAIIAREGSPRPPYGYRVPPDQYTVRLWGFTGSEVKLSVFSNSILLGYDRNGGGPDQTDRLEIGDHLAFTNPDTVGKLARFQIIMPEDTTERAYYVANLLMRQNDSLALKPGAGSRLDIANAGVSKTYDLRLVTASGGYSGEFVGNGIALGENTTHRLEPSWSSLDTSLLRILVDTGNDGFFDDTLLLHNDLTGVSPGGTLVPDEFELMPCYPNPFNPITTITYRLPTASNVRLALYDLLGRTVAVLLDERKVAGVHTVRFDAKGLASGVYLCRLVAGKFTQVQKMVLAR